VFEVRNVETSRPGIEAEPSNGNLPEVIVPPAVSILEVVMQFLMFGNSLENLPSARHHGALLLPRPLLKPTGAVWKHEKTSSFNGPAPNRLAFETTKIGLGAPPLLMTRLASIYRLRNA
jgi:hypothetical protein